ncbi:hypothetical protein D3C78_1551880 [compost metagenome]
MPVGTGVRVVSRTDIFAFLFQLAVAVLQPRHHGSRLLPAENAQQIHAVAFVHQHDMEGIAVIDGPLHDLAARGSLAGIQFIAPPLRLRVIVRQQRKTMREAAVIGLPAQYPLDSDGIQVHLNPRGDPEGQPGREVQHPAADSRTANGHRQDG